MKFNYEKFFLLTVTLFFSSFLFSQEYKTAIGLRGGWKSGATAKQFIEPDRAIEGIFSTNQGWKGYRITALYEVHRRDLLDEVEGLYWYFGGGVHFGDGGFYYYRWKDDSFLGVAGYYEKKRYYAFGMDGVLGLDYKIKNLPLSVSVDINPFFDFFDHKNIVGIPSYFLDCALSIRYLLT